MRGGEGQARARSAAAAIMIGGLVPSLVSRYHCACLQYSSGSRPIIRALNLDSLAGGAAAVGAGAEEDDAETEKEGAAAGALVVEPTGRERVAVGPAASREWAEEWPWAGAAPATGPAGAPLRS